MFARISFGSFLLKTLIMLGCYWFAVGSLFLVFDQAVFSGTKVINAFVVFGFISLLSFWFYMFVTGTIWILSRHNIARAIPVTIVGCILWATFTAMLESYQVRPGYFGRAINDGQPTIFYYIDMILVACCAILLFECVELLFHKQRKDT